MVQDCKNEDNPKDGNRKSCNEDTGTKVQKGNDFGDSDSIVAHNCYTVARS